MKQASSSLLSEKLILEKQLQQVNTSLESSKLKMTRGEEQVVSYFCYFFCIVSFVGNLQSLKLIMWQHIPRKICDSNINSKM